MLQHIYEYRFEQQKLGDRVDEARELLKSPDERKEEEEQELRRLDEDEAYLVRESLRLADQKPKPKPIVTPPPLPDLLPDLPTIKFDPEPNPS